MIGDDWILGWIVDGLAKCFGKAMVAGWIAIAAILVLVSTGVMFALGLAPYSAGK